MASRYADQDQAGANARTRRNGASTKAQDTRAQAQQEGGFKGKLLALRGRLEQYAVFRVLESTVLGFMKDKGTENAAAMTYYGIFSLFPLILLFMAMAGLALQSNEAAREQIMNVIVGLLPQGQDQLRKVIAGVIEAKGVATGIGLLALVWSAIGWFQVIDSNINEIWGVSKSRNFIKGKLFALAMVAGIGTVAIGSFVATAAIHLVERFTGSIPGSVLFWQLVVSLVSIFTIAAAFFVLYRFSPQRKVYFADIWPAALATALLWELTRRVLAFYLEKNDMISGYGPIGAAMALLFWIYVASIIILLGAELAYSVAKERRHLEPDEEMNVVAAPGEQPTPKFAPQVGGGVPDSPKAEERPNGQPATAPGHRQNGHVPSNGQRRPIPANDSPRHTVSLPVHEERGQRAGKQDQANASDQSPGIPKRVLSTALAAGVGLILNKVRHGSGDRPHASTRK
jgi:membrane protein